MHYLRDEGSKAHSKGGRVRKCTTYKVMAHRCTKKKVWLENSLPKRWSRAQRRTREGMVGKHTTQSG